MTPIKVHYVISGIDRSLAFEWINERYNREKYTIEFILLNRRKSHFQNYLIETNTPHHFVKSTGFGFSWLVVLKLMILFLKQKPHVIHCHLFEASLFGLLAGMLAGIKKRIYTRHHSSYNWTYNRKGVVLDKFINRLATDIVSISPNVSRILIEKEKIPSPKIHYVPHGFDLDSFMQVDSDNVQRLRKKYKLGGKTPVIGVIARWIEWKGVQYIIPAFQEILKSNPDACLLLANANGPYRPTIEILLSQLPETACRIIPFEPDSRALYQLFDIYVHVPVDPEIEAFGQTYVEALAAGIPSVFTLSGIAHEFIIDNHNALTVEYKSSKTIVNAVLRLLAASELKDKLKNNGRKSIQRYALKKMLSRLEEIYD